ncbi:ArsR/SmtB family transcription factor [Embleya hyalina]|uniref:Transcriptional regulator n=1 Tax=Embleya hyalina TaxID=516124 RepID=A0A401YIV6_9ACTN|nr:helix-turn-helix transcriptional regulator [Embleya hyalina]GCD94531.1 transcriptional regulator [Embleya hyalina]
MPVQMHHPSLDEVALSAVFAALSDDHRRGVVVTLAADPDRELPCSALSVPGSKSTRSYHWKVLREAGLIVQRNTGTGMTLRLRAEEFDARFPGLLTNLLHLEGITPAPEGPAPEGPAPEGPAPEGFTEPNPRT